MKAQKLIQPESQKCGVQIHEERENQDTEQKNEGSTKDRDNRKDCTYKVLEENVKQTKGKIKPQGDDNDQETSFQSKQFRKEKNEIKG